ncbi:MAG: hypothetical protein ACOYD9_07545 [Pyramidobacter sp.]|jgi:VIT1/CCC1 family predicted Fe2+/Mn2+ transporter
MNDQDNINEQNVKLGESALNAALEAQRRTAEAAAIFDALANRAGSESEILKAAAAEKKDLAGSLSELTGQADKVLRRRKIWWIALSRLFGNSFVISRIEAGEAAAFEKFASAAFGVPEAEEYGKKAAQISQKLDAAMDTAALQSIKTAVYRLYGTVVLFVSMLSAFAVHFSLRSAATAALCAAAAFALAGTAAAFSSRSAAGRSAALRSAVTFAFESALAALVLLWPYFAFRSTWGALPVSALLAVTITAALAYFAAVTRRQKYAGVFLEMLITGIIAAAAAPLLIFLLKAGLKLHG